MSAIDEMAKRAAEQCVTSAYSRGVDELTDIIARHYREGVRELEDTIVEQRRQLDELREAYALLEQRVRELVPAGRGMRDVHPNTDTYALARERLRQALEGFRDVE